MTKRKLLAILSTLISDTPLKDTTKSWLCGFTYVGELFQANFTNLSYGGRRQRGAEDVLRYFRSLNLPGEIDLNRLGWIPPYFTGNQKREVFEYLYKPLHEEVHRRKFRCLGCKSAGAFAQDTPVWSRGGFLGYRLGFEKNLFVPACFEMPRSHEPVILMEPTIENIGSLRLYDLHFSDNVRTQWLIEAGIENLTDLLKLTASDLLKVRGFSIRSLQGIEKTLEAEGLHLGMLRNSSL